MQLDFFQDTTKENVFTHKKVSCSDQKILDVPDYGIFEKHRKVTSVHRLIKFNKKIK